MFSIFRLARQQLEDTAAAVAALCLLQGSKETLSFFFFFLKWRQMKE